MKKEGYYSSGEFARMAHVTLRTIRYYDKQNILKPSYVSDAGARFYTDEDLARRAHYITVTGIEHGWLRISSWGQEWYINWREYRNFAWIKSCPLFSNICYITRKH